MRILVVSADSSLADQVLQPARRAGFDVTAIADSAGARNALGRYAPDVLAVDGAPSLEAAISLCEAARSARPSTETLVFLADASTLASLPLVVTEFMIKPFCEGHWLARLERLAARCADKAAALRHVALATAVEAAEDIIEIANPSAVLQYVNPAFERTLGYRREEAVGVTPAKLIRSDMHTPEYFRTIDETLRAGRVWEGLLISRARDGRLVYLESTIAPVFDDSGAITHHVGVKRDVTKRIFAERELRDRNREIAEARDAAVAASQAKSQFVANMSHELRTPLNAIIGYSEIFGEEAEASGQRDMLDDLGKITAAGRHLLALITDVLDISKIEAGRMQFVQETFAVADLVSEVVATVDGLFRERGNRLRIDCGDNLESMVADPTRLRQVLINLLSNANKFTENGEVHFLAEREAAWVKFVVADNGIGMDAAQQERVFDPFTQADASTTRKYGGVGLGLAITKRICDMMGGRIELESTPGRGSTFTVLLPLADREGASTTPSVVVRHPRAR